MNVCGWASRCWLLVLAMTMSAAQTVPAGPPTEAQPLQFIQRFRHVYQDVRALAWQPGGKVLMMSGGRDTRAWDVQTGRLRWSFPNWTGGHALAFSPDGQWIVSDRHSDRSDQVWVGVYRASDGRKVMTMRLGQASWVSALSWSPDGKWIAVGTGDESQVQLLHAGTLTVDRVLEPVCRYPNGLAWRPGGVNELLLSCQDGTAELYDVGGVEYGPLEGMKPQVGRTLKWIFTPPDRHNSFGNVAWNPDGSRIALAWANRIIVLDPLTGRSELEFAVDPTGKGYTVEAVAWSPDSRVLAVAGANQFISLHDSQTGVHLQDLGARAAANSAVAFSPDGRYVVSGYGSPNADFLSLWGTAHERPVFGAVPRR